MKMVYRRSLNKWARWDQFVLCWRCKWFLIWCLWRWWCMCCWTNRRISIISILSWRNVYWAEWGIWSRIWVRSITRIRIWTNTNLPRRVRRNCYSRMWWRSWGNHLVSRARGRRGRSHCCRRRRGRKYSFRTRSRRVRSSCLH